jgi:hypothetical protein
VNKKHRTHKFDYQTQEELVTELMIVTEELEHLQMVHDLKRRTPWRERALIITKRIGLSS